MNIPGWLGSLNPETRETVFSWMRKTGDRIQAGYAESRALEPPCGTMISVGAGAFDPFVLAETAEEYLRFLRVGKTPAEAWAGSKVHARLCVSKHNARRKRDIHWRRWEGTADSHLDNLHRTLLAI